MIREGTRKGPFSLRWGRLSLGTKILVPIFLATFATAMGSAVFFTLQQVDQDRLARDTEGRTVAIVVQGALEESVGTPDASTLGDMLQHVNLAYPDVAAICVLVANPADPLGHLVLLADSEPAIACDQGSPLAPGLGVLGIHSMTRHTSVGRVEETVVGAGLSKTGRSAVVEVLVRVTPFANLAWPTFTKASAAGLLLAAFQTGIVFLVLWFSALRPLKRLRLAASAAARAAQPATRDLGPQPIGAGDEIGDLSMRFEQMLVAVRDRERDLVESNLQLENLIANAPVQVFSTDGEGRMLQLRGIGADGIPKALGHEQIEDATVFEIAGPNAELTAILKRALAGEKIHEVVKTERWLEDGLDPMYLDVILSPSFDGQRKIIGITGMTVDVTGRVDAASARAESEQKSAFLAVMSHELRTPLNSIMGFSQLLDMPGAKPALNTKQKRYVGHILSSGSHLLALVGDILDLAKVGASQVEVTMEAVPIHDLVLEPVDQIVGLAAEKGIAIDVFLPPELVVFTDRNRARQMLHNLLANAVKFTAKDGARILVSARAVEGEVEISVADSGIGIALEDQDKIFDEFTQVDQGRSRSLDGTGLGLTLTRRLATLVGGTVRVESALGVGSTFTIRLPGVAAKPEPAVELVGAVAG